MADGGTIGRRALPSSKREPLMEQRGIAGEGWIGHERGKRPLKGGHHAGHQLLALVYFLVVLRLLPKAKIKHRAVEHRRKLLQVSRGACRRDWRLRNGPAVCERPRALFGKWSNSRRCLKAKDEPRLCKVKPRLRHLPVQLQRVTPVHARVDEHVSRRGAACGLWPWRGSHAVVRYVTSTTCMDSTQ